MNLHTIIQFLYNLSPVVYSLQLDFFNGNHFQVLHRKLRNIPTQSILELGCGAAPILEHFHPNEYIGYAFDITR